MRRMTLLLSTLILCTACATTPPVGTYANHADYMAAQGIIPADVPPPQSVTVTQIEMKCLAFASQVAQGAGGWTSVAPVRAAIYDHARAQYYQQCIAAGGF